MTRLLVVLLAAGCSQSSPGFGTGTLFVNATVEGKPESTLVNAEVKLRGTDLTGANVVVKNVETGATTNLEARRGGYRAQLSGYVRTIHLSITSGDDQLEAQLAGPSAHVITRPPNNAIVRRGDGDVLGVEWEADGPAEAVVLDLRGIDPIRLDRDLMSHDVPLGGLDNGDQTIEVRRENRIELAGGTEGSQMTIAYTVDNRFTLE